MRGAFGRLPAVVLSRFVILAICVLPWLGSSGCADVSEQLLEGSLGEFYALDCETVRARLYDSEFAVEFVDVTGEVPVRVSFSRRKTDPTGAVTVDLVEFGDITGSNQGTPIPRFTDGVLYLYEYSQKDGAEVRGEFDATFVSGFSEVTLHGEFITTLTVVENRF